LLELGEVEEALAAAGSEPSAVFRLVGVALARHALGQQAEFERAFQELREQLGEIVPSFVAMVYAYTGDVDGAFDWLDRVTPESPFGMELTFLTQFSNLHDDPRWTAYRERMG